MTSSFPILAKERKQASSFQSTEVSQFPRSQEKEGKLSEASSCFAEVWGEGEGKPPLYFHWGTHYFSLELRPSAAATFPRALRKPPLTTLNRNLKVSTVVDSCDQKNLRKERFFKVHSFGVQSARIQGHEVAMITLLVRSHEVRRECTHSTGFLLGGSLLSF